MAEFILKNRYGKDRSFDKETIFVKGADGELMQFTHGAGNPVVQPLSITENGTYTAPEGVDGYNPVTVAVPAPEIKLQDKTITENGEYTADSGFDGLGKVTVEVEGSGGGSLPAGLYWKPIEFTHPDITNTTFRQYVKLNGVLYAFVGGKSSYYTDYFQYIYKKENDTWEKIYDNGSLDYSLVVGNFSFFEYNGRLHYASDGTHYVFDGVNITKIGSIGSATSGNCLFEEDGLLKVYGYYKKTVFVFDEDTNAWTAERTLNPPDQYVYFYRINGALYAVSNKNLYTYKNGDLEFVVTLKGDPSSWSSYCDDRYIYWMEGGDSTVAKVRRTDTITGETEYIGNAPTPNPCELDGKWYVYKENASNCCVSEMVVVSE